MLPASALMLLASAKGGWLWCAALFVMKFKPERTNSWTTRVADAVLQLLLLLAAQLSHATKDVQAAEKKQLGMVREHRRLANKKGVIATLPVCTCCSGACISNCWAPGSCLTFLP